jgi:lantibiotic biosynthesis dehydratase-like protein
MAGFSSPPCTRQLSDIRYLQRELAQSLSEMVDRLYAAVPGTSASVRRVLLEVKRDAFNGRSLDRHYGTTYWEEIRQLAGPAADRVHCLEEELASAQTGFEETYAREHERQRRRLFGLLENRVLLRGVALASPVLVEDLDRHVRHSADPRDTRLEVSLLRYISRAALKLSPYSTLTRLALGRAGDEGELAGRKGIRLLGSGWRQRSLVRLKRYSLSQISELLLSHPPLREGLRVVLNNSAEELEPGRYRFLKPAGWDLDPKSSGLRFVLPSIVKAGLGGPVASWIWRELPKRNLTWSGLMAALAEELAGERDSKKVVQEVAELWRLGFLRCLWPWPANEGHLEKRLLSFLSALPCREIRPVAERLGRLVSLEEAFAEAPDPARFAREIDGLLEEIWQAVLRLLGAGPGIRRPRVQKGEVYEDVLLLPLRFEDAPEVFEVPASSAREALRNVQPVFQLSCLFHSRYDFLHAVAEVMFRRWPNRREVGVLEALSEVQPLWREYVRFTADARREDGSPKTFNPLNLRRVEKLADFREVIWRDALASVRSEGGESRISAEILRDALGKVPEMYAPPVGACLFLQQLEGSGRRWMVNRMFEGTGRYASRFTVLMDKPVQDSYLDHLKERSAVKQHGERLELLDLLCAQGDTLNVHAFQTRRVLETPGEETDLPDLRRLQLTDLRIRRCDRSALPVLVDVSGRSYLPVHLGGASQEFLPAPLKLLCLLGPTELRAVYPPPQIRQEGKATLRERLTLGNLVLLRKRWIVPPDALPTAADKLHGVRAFTAINNWRVELGIPDRVFVIERISHSPAVISKPQLIDFTSPLFVNVFSSILQSPAPALIMEEVLPDVHALPCDAEGRRWCVELMLDSLAFQETFGYDSTSSVNDSLADDLVARSEKLKHHAYC